MNKVQLIGNLVKDPEFREMSNDKRVASIRLCTETRRKGKKYTEFHNISIYNQGLVGLIEKYSGKGDKIYIEGSLRNTSWEVDGQTRYGYEIAVGQNDQLEFLGSPRRQQEPDHDQNDDIPY
ncbi:single-stranded DNA-binding protein [Brevundimonas nasdae]|uniref:Single-stranded DNA-binding protein n=1 Tax=Brevundimonas nasdae TaxID=172043 RepID=A0ABX8TPY1_9CAUL|nr:single-stranded DNA-binding protein [Brevundimonas nasdae]QYC12347.1 single-stranded DNA-binding protein [Brevundimonas nasdae]